MPRIYRKKKDTYDLHSNYTSKLHLVILSTFFLSGFLSITYQVVWSRILNLIFGSTTQSIVTVLAVFMLGLSMGSFLTGHYTTRKDNFKSLYAIIEINLGIYAAVCIFILHGIQEIHSFLFFYLYTNHIILTLLRILLAGAFLIIPTLLMGATLPVLSQLLDTSDQKTTLHVGRLYALNTLGAALGAFFSAFIIIPLVGLYWTLWSSAAVNILIGFYVLSLSPVPDRELLSKPHIPPTKTPGEQVATRSAKRFFALIAFTGVGFVGMLLENGWSRALIMVFGTSVYAFATMLTAYLVGLGLGSLASGWFADRISFHKISFTLSILILLLGLSVYFTTPIIGQLPGWFVSIFSDANSTWAEIVLLEFGVSFLFMFFPTFISGACFPFVSRLVTEGTSIGRAAANAYAANTVGAVAGSLCAGFILIPIFGSERTLLIAGGLAIFIASGLLPTTFNKVKASRYIVPAGFVTIAVVGILMPSSWDKMVMNSGVYIYSRYMKTHGQSISNIMAHYKMLYYEEGSTATVSVLESDKGHRFLRVNGKTDGSSEGDNYTQMMLGYLPAIYTSTLENALIIGLGTGITSASILDLPVSNVDTIEISPEVINAASYFSDLNKSVFDDSRSSIHNLDGRTWLMAMPKQYDIITSEPSNHWQTGNANLFTVVSSVLPLIG